MFIESVLHVSLYKKRGLQEASTKIHKILRNSSNMSEKYQEK